MIYIYRERERNQIAITSGRGNRNFEGKIASFHCISSYTLSQAIKSIHIFNCLPAQPLNIPFRPSVNGLLLESMLSNQNRIAGDRSTTTSPFLKRGGKKEPFLRMFDRLICHCRFQREPLEQERQISGYITMATEDFRMLLLSNTSLNHFTLLSSQRVRTMP